MSRSIIDITRHVDRAMKGLKPTGVDRAGLAYVEHFAESSLALVRFGGRWVILNQSDSRHIFKAVLNPGKNFIWLVRLLVGKNYAFNWSRKSYGKLLLNITHNGLEEPVYVKQIKKRRLKPVFFLHDIIPITHPEYCRAGDMEKHEKRLHTMLSTASGIIVNSHDTKQELRAYAAIHNYTLPPCVCAWAVAATLPLPSPTRLIAKPYFVVLSTIEARKNHLLLLNIWRELALKLGEAAPQLIIIGRRGWECENVIDMLERCRQIKHLVTEKPNCDDADLATWLAHAQALLFPSFAEGFGLPLVEALALNTPVIASNLGVFHEIAGDIPDYANPIDAPAWEQLIIDYTAKDSVRAASQRERMQSYAAPTWAEHFAKVDRFLQDAAI